MTVNNIKSMKLYQHFERVDNEIKELMPSINGRTLKASDLFPFDNMHYFGVDAVREALEPVLKRMVSQRKEMGITEPIRVLDVGSGLGGPARFIAEELNCSVTAIELQEDCHKKAMELTEQVGLQEKIT